MTSNTSKGIAKLESLIRRERAIIAASLALAVLVSWGYLASGAGTGMSPSHMSTWRFPPTTETLFGPGEWSPQYTVVMAMMWFVMMVAMMLPSAAPMMLIYARVYRQGQLRGQISEGPLPVAAFALGYLLCWLAFSFAATALQFAFEHTGLIDGMWMWSLNKYFTSVLLVAAGLYQLTPLKAACLDTCRSPAAFLSAHWKPGTRGAFRIGVIHGTYCIGCCWVLMLLLFAGGIMNLFWIAGLAVLVLLEKLAPFGARLSCPIGMLLIAAGLAVAAMA